MRIFIASSSKHLEDKEYGKPYGTNYTTPMSLASNLTQKLRESKLHTVKPWWENGVLKFGNGFLESIIKMTNICNGGIFIFGKDEEKVDSEGEGSKFGTRDNVLIESGMFISKYGINRTCILVEEWNKGGEKHCVTIPFDYRGVKHIRFNKGESISIRTAINDTVTFFDEEFDIGINLKKVTAFCNIELPINIVNNTNGFENWCSKALYIGYQSAKCWSDIELHNDYKGKKDLQIFEGLFNEIEIKFNYPPIENVISLGSGVGEIDRRIINFLFSESGFNKLNYIPIDINPYLALMATKTIFEDNSKIDVPYIIIYDFEKDLNDIGHIISEKIKIKEQKNIYFMLGGTFTNLSKTEYEFVTGLKGWMSDNDYLLIDIFTKSILYDSYSEKLNFVFRKEENENILINSIQCKNTKLVANEIHTKYPEKRSESIDELAKKLLNNIEIKSSISDGIKNTTLNVYKYKETDQTLFTVKKYFFEDFKFFLEKHFTIVSFAEGEIDNQINQGRGVFIVRTKIEQEKNNYKRLRDEKKLIYEDFSKKVSELIKKIKAIEKNTKDAFETERFSDEYEKLLTCYKSNLENLV
ncbi:MAG: L-histidine N(alpha)-methyltransferase [Bacteroidales bacterium]|nr:L-histidine N(alpha)-methyltransferase [Bacteroidales bacterium]